jgi:hypothetical protein
MKTFGNVSNPLHVELLKKMDERDRPMKMSPATEFIVVTTYVALAIMSGKAKGLHPVIDKSILRNKPSPEPVLA